MTTETPPSDHPAPPPPTQRARKGLGFLLQQLRDSSASTSAPSTSEDSGATTATFSVATSASADTQPPPKIPKPNPWLVSRDSSPRTLTNDVFGNCLTGGQPKEPIQVIDKPFMVEKSRFYTQPLEIVNNFVRSAKWSPSGKHLLTDAADHRSRIFHFNEETRLLDATETVEIPMGGIVYDQVWHPSLEAFASTSNGRPVQIVNTSAERLATPKAVNHLDEIDYLRSLAFSLDGTRLYGGCKSKIYVFDLTRPSKQSNVVRTWSKNEGGQKGILSCIAMNPSFAGSYAVGSYNGQVGIYADNVKSATMTFTTPERNVSQLAFLPDGNALVYGSTRSTALHAVDVRMATRPLAALTRFVDTQQRIFFDIDRSGRFLFSGTTAGEVVVFDLKKLLNEAVDPLEPDVRIAVGSRVCAGVALHPNAPILATSHGERVFPKPWLEEFDSDDENLPEKPVLDFGVKLWSFV